MSAQSDDPLVFDTAVAVNTKKPRYITVRHYAVNDEGEYTDLDENDDPIQIVVKMRVDPRVTFLKLRGLFNSLQQIANTTFDKVDEIKKERAEADQPSTLDFDEVSEMMEEAAAEQRKEFRKLFVPPDREKFDTISADLDPTVMMRMTMGLMKDLRSGMDPTERTDSPSKLSETGESSTPGPSAEESN